MRRKITSREWGMIAFLAAVGLFAIFSRGGRGTASGDGTAGLEELDVSLTPVVDMAALNAQPVTYDPEGRSLFKYYEPPRPQPVRTPPPRPTEVRKPPPPPPPQPDREPRERGPATIPPPKPNFTYLGFFGPKDNKIAVFEDKDDIMLAQTGDVVWDKFIVLDFKYEGVVLGFTEKRFAGQTTELPQLNIAKKGR